MAARPYRADQVGSLLRPAELLQARSQHAPESSVLRELEDSAIRDALERQRSIGIDVLVDGELRRGAWQTDMADAVDGFVPDNVAMEWHGPTDVVEGSSAQVVGAPLRQRRRLTEHESTFLLANAGGPCKVTLPSPSVFMITSFKPGVTDRHYPSRRDLLDVFIRIVRAEVEALVSEGVAYVQLDAPQYSYYLDERLRERLAADGVDPDTALADAIAADNACVEGLSNDAVTTGLHICRGNRRSMWFAQGGYEPIAEHLFATCTADRLLLEYDTERAGGFEPLRYVDDRTVVVLGLVSSKVPDLEPRDQVLRRIDDAARHHPVDRLALSPQCGFASNAAGNALEPEEQWAKLEQVVELAREVWP